MWRKNIYVTYCVIYIYNYILYMYIYTYYDIYIYIQGGQTWTCQQVVVSFANRCHRSRCHQHRPSAEAASEEVVLCPLPILRLAIAVTFQGKLLLKPLIKMCKVARFGARKPSNLQSSCAVVPRQGHG